MKIISSIIELNIGNIPKEFEISEYIDFIEKTGYAPVTSLPNIVVQTVIKEVSFFKWLKYKLYGKN